jgi:two-component system nitrogen regulation sensor histidine kinase NtrY
VLLHRHSVSQQTHFEQSGARKPRILLQNVGVPVAPPLCGRDLYASQKPSSLRLRPDVMNGLQSRTKLLPVFLTAVLASVSVAYGVSHYACAASEQMNAQRTEAIVALIQKEFVQRGDDVVELVQDIADANTTLMLAIDLARPKADQSLYARDAIGAVHDQLLDFVEIVGWDGTVISSAQYPARVGQKNDWVLATKDWRDSPAFLKREELPDGEALSLTAVRSVSDGSDKYLYIVGGRRIDHSFLSLLLLPPGVRVLLYRSLEPTFVPANLTDAAAVVAQADRFAPLIDQIQKRRQSFVQTIDWTSDPSAAETFHVMPLEGRNREPLGVLLVGSSLKELVLLKRRIVLNAAEIAAAALFSGPLISLWIGKLLSRTQTRRLRKDFL